MRWGEEWRTDAACRDYPTAMFFPDEGTGRMTDWETPRAVCITCPVRSACRDFAVATRMTDGMWGGLTPAQLRTVSRKARAARYRRAS